MNIAGLIVHYQYVFLFVGMFFLGETVFLPAAYISLHGTLTPWIVLVVSALATVCSDLTWYYAAYRVSERKVGQMKTVKKNKPLYDKLSRLFNVYDSYILFASKFVYGVRILVQLISGMKHIPLFRYLVINMLGSLVYLSALFLLAKAVDVTQARFLIGGIKTGIISLILIALIINICIHFIAKKKMSL